MKTFIHNIKKAETPFYANMNRFIKGILTCSIPSVKMIHYPLYNFHVFVKTLWNRLYTGMWCVPAFAAKCHSCGNGLKLPNGMPLVLGNPKMILGNNVTILDSTLASGHVYETSELIIGNNVTVGYHSDISVSQRVEIGNDTIIAKDCYIADNNGHPVSPSRRRVHSRVNEDEISPVKIGENVWIGTSVCILKGVTIGDNSIISANSVVIKNVPPNTIVGGNPAKVIREITEV